MSGKQKKTSLLGKLVGKGKDNDEGGKKTKKKGKLEKQPSLRESIHSERAHTMRTGTHLSDGAPLHYEEEHYGAPVTAVHEDDPYSPYEDGGSLRQPSAINVHRASNVHGGGGYFDQPYNDSPRGTVHQSAGEHEVPNEHAETAHPNVFSLDGHGGMHMEPHEHVAVAGSSRQATILAPGGSSETPRMLKPGDQMEIDPRNPPTFVIDEGITLEIGDEENGFMPYEQYLANLAKQPPPKTGGTYIVQGGGDVVIQDENGAHIRTIPGTGANAGRGPPQIHEVNGSTIVVL